MRQNSLCVFFPSCLYFSAMITPNFCPIVFCFFFFFVPTIGWILDTFSQLIFYWNLFTISNTMFYIIVFIYLFKTKLKALHQEGVNLKGMHKFINSSPRGHVKATTTQDLKCKRKECVNFSLDVRRFIPSKQKILF